MSTLGFPEEFRDLGGAPTVEGRSLLAAAADAFGLNQRPDRARTSCVANNAVQTALRICTGDEGKPFGFGDQVADPNPPQAAAVKCRGSERCGNAGPVIRQARSREASVS